MLRTETPSPDRSRVAFVAALALATAVFVVDLHVPLGVAMGTLYVATLTLLLGSRVPWHPPTQAAFCSLLTALDVVFGPPGPSLRVALFNRGVSVLAIWLVALLVARRTASGVATPRLPPDADTRKVVHDVSNALAVVVASAELARRQSAAPPAVKEDLESILRAASGASHLVRGLLGTRHASSPPTPAKVNEVVRQALHALSRLAGPGIQLTAHLDALHDTTTADPESLVRALENLVANARDALPRGGHVHLATRDAWVDEAHAASLGVEPGRYLLLTVSDDGVGMTEEVQRRIFEPFFTTKAHGTGVGLSNVRDSVRRAGGGLEVTSSPGHGTTFRIFLPCTPAATTRSAPRPADGGAARVLVVDDDTAVRRTIARTLRGAGYGVVEAQDGTSALRELQGVDLVVADLDMPGSELLGEGLGVPVLRVSGCAVAPDDARFLRKPFAPRQLVERVHELIRKRAVVPHRSAHGPRGA